MSRFWVTCWSMALSVSWLLPNHYAPWSTFHMDAWASFVILLAFGVAVSKQHQVPLHRLTLLALIAAAIPFAQYFSGLIGSAGTAWISTAYVLGFALSLVTGVLWESAKPDQMADALFFAIGLASIVSVGLQLHQWLSLDLLGVWSMGDGYGRPFANFGQPNQLGTLLLWGVLAAAWGHSRRYLGVSTTLLMVSFLLVGVALTQSRTAWIGISLIVALSWFWRDRWSNRLTPTIATVLGVGFIVCNVSLSWVNEIFLLTLPSDQASFARISGEQRPAVWRLFLDAALHEPVWGYGWNQVGWAQLRVVTDHPPLHQLFSHSHNLILDLILWCGMPIGLLLASCLMGWFWLHFKQTRNEQDILLILFIAVVANHAMLELPLHHAYFLFPVGLVMGAMNVRAKTEAILHITRTAVVAVGVFSTLLFGLVIRDYAKVESTYQALRFEWAGYKAPGVTPIPELSVLTMWSDYFALLRLEPNNEMSKEQIAKLIITANNFPSAGFLEKLAYTLAINGRPDEAALWLRKMCRMIPVAQCEIVKASWERKAVGQPLLSNVVWSD